MASGTLLVSCSGGSSTEACELAAAGQAHAEQLWQEEFEKHVLADEALSEHPDSISALFAHDHSAEALFSARVNMVLAEHKTRRECS